MDCPTAVLPVNVTISTSGDEARRSPTVLPGPTTRLTVPFGRPTSSNISKSLIVESIVSELGLNTILLPAASAGASFQMAIRNG